MDLVDTPQPRYIKNIDMKREVREELHYFYWLRGYKLREIEEMTGWERTTIWEDLNRVRAALNVTPRSMEQIRSEALISLRLLHQDILKTITEAKAKAAPYSQIKGLYSEAAGIDKTILQRYTPSASAPEITAQKDEQLMAMIDYLQEKLGPEALEGFQEWWTARMGLKAGIKAKKAA